MSPPAWTGVCALAGVVLSLGWVTDSGWVTAFFAVVPVIAAAKALSVRYSALCGLAFGLGFALVGVFWLTSVTWLGFLALSLYVALYHAAFAAALSWSIRLTRLPEISLAPPLWAFLEMLRCRMLSGFPWLFLGHSQSENVGLVQVAAIGGVYAVSFLVVLVNAALAQMAPLAEAERGKAGLPRIWMPAGTAFGAILLSLFYGGWRVSGEPHEGSKVALVQAGINTRMDKDDEAAQRKLDERMWAAQVALTKRAMEDAPEIILWSESVLPGFVNNNEEWEGKIEKLAAELKTPILAGGSATDGPEKDTNSAFLVSPGGEWSRYDKVKLVPFGEYVPMKWLPFMSRLTPYTTDGWTPGGAGQELFRLGKYRFGISICYEDAFPSRSRHDALKGADFLVNISNDSWFAGTAELAQHARIARFRAIETGLPLVRCSNVGITCVYGSRGIGRAYVEPPDVKVTHVPMRKDYNHTVYARSGDFFAFACGAAVALAAAVAFVKKRLAARREREDG